MSMSNPSSPPAFLSGRWHGSTVPPPSNVPFAKKPCEPALPLVDAPIVSQVDHAGSSVLSLPAPRLIVFFFCRRRRRCRRCCRRPRPRPRPCPHPPRRSCLVARHIWADVIICDARLQGWRSSACASEHPRHCYPATAPRRIRRADSTTSDVWHVWHVLRCPVTTAGLLGCDCWALQAVGLCSLPPASALVPCALRPWVALPCIALHSHSRPPRRFSFSPPPERHPLSVLQSRPFYIWATWDALEPSRTMYGAYYLYFAPLQGCMSFACFEQLCFENPPPCSALQRLASPGCCLRIPCDVRQLFQVTRSRTTQTRLRSTRVHELTICLYMH